MDAQEKINSAGEAMPENPIMEEAAEAEEPMKEDMEETKLEEASAEEEAPQKKNKKKDKKPKTLNQKIMSWVWTILFAFVLAFLIRTFVAELIRVDGTSMTNTLQNGEVVLVSKLDYAFHDVQRGDIVICRYPGRINKRVDLGSSLSLDVHTMFVKRVVALPGDTLAIVNGKLFVNGEVVPDPPKMGSTPRDFPGIILGPDQYFVIGDNRYSSHDSRGRDVGPISRDAIMGKVKCVIFPLSQIRGVD